MWNTKLGFATLALGSFLTLLGPAAASARDRDDFRQNDNRSYTSGYTNNGYTNNSYTNNGYTGSFRHRETRRERELRLRLELERLEQQRRFRNQRGHDGNSGFWNR